MFEHNPQYLLTLTLHCSRKKTFKSRLLTNFRGEYLTDKKSEITEPYFFFFFGWNVRLWLLLIEEGCPALSCSFSFKRRGMQSEHQCFTGASGRRGWEPIVLQRDQFLTKRKMVSTEERVIRHFRCLYIYYNVSFLTVLCLKYLKWPLACNITRLVLKPKLSCQSFS